MAARLSELLGREVRVVPDWVNGVQVKPGQVVILENARANKGEKKDDEALARKIAALAERQRRLRHRAPAEATTHGAARFAPVAVAGPLMAAELDALGKALAQPARPLVAIVGGSKVSTKLSLLAELVSKVDRLIVGGGIANTFLLAAGKAIGKSLAEPDLVGEAKRIMASGKVPLPTDVVVSPRLDRPGTVKSVDAVTRDEMILDIGPQTAKAYAHELKKAGTIVWNGPVRVREGCVREGNRDAGPRHRGREGVFHRWRRRHGGSDQQVRHRRRDRLHLDRRRRIPRISRRQEAPGSGRARGESRVLTAHADG